MIRALRSIFLLSMSLLALSCTKPDEILNDFDVHVNPTFYRYIAITDLELANDSLALLPSNLKVTVSGPDANRIYALDGTRNFKASGNIVQLMVPTEFEPQGGSSLRFKVSATASGFLRSSTSYSISEGDFYQSKSISLYNESNLPSNIAVNRSSFATDPSTGLIMDTVKASVQNGDGGVALSIPPGWRFMDSEGNIITGKKATHYEIEIVQGEIFIAVWDGAIDLTIPTHDSGGNVVSLGEGEDFSFGIVDGAGEVTTLLEPPANFNQGHSSKPKVRLEVSPTLFNPETLQNFKKGDRVGVKYLDESTQMWTYISQNDFFVEEDDDGDLFVEFELSQGDFNEDNAYKLWYSSKLSADNEYTITSNFASPNVPVTHGTLELVFEIVNTNIQYTVDLAGTFININNALFNSNPKAEIKTLHPVVLKEIRAKSGSIKNENYLFNASQTGNGWNIDIDYNSTVDPVTLAYRLRCDGAFIQPPVGVVMYYREHDPNDEAPFNELYRFVNNTVTQYSFTELVDGDYYDFRAQYGPDQVDTNNVKVIDGHTYDITLPDVICNKIGF